MMLRARPFVLWGVAAFYLYGALVHVLNMANGFNGVAWSAGPLKWQALDVIVVAGLARGARFGIAAFYLAASSQIVLYTLLRRWVVDVPIEFAVSDEQDAYLSLLVLFHLATLVLVTLVLRGPAASEVDVEPSEHPRSPP